MAIMLPYFTEFCSPWAQVDLAILSREMSSSSPTKHDGRDVLSAVAELIVESREAAD